MVDKVWGVEGSAKSAMSWSECKARGNQLYQAKRYSDAVEAYSEALALCKDKDDKAILLKNRAAAHLKLKSFKEALVDCDAALVISPRDIKCLYRRSQALEGAGQLSEAFKTIKTLLALDPSNKEASASASRLVETIRQQADVQQSTSEKVKDMFATLASGTDESLKVRAAKNFAILSRESAGCRELLADNGLVKLVRLIDSESDEVVHHILQTFIGLCSGGPEITVALVKTISLDKLASAVKRAEKGVSTSAVALLRTVTATLSSAATVASEEVLVSTVQVMLVLMLSSDVTASSRDAVLEAITTTLQQVCVCGHTCMCVCVCVCVRVHNVSVGVWVWVLHVAGMPNLFPHCAAGTLDEDLLARRFVGKSPSFVCRLSCEQC